MKHASPIVLLVALLCLAGIVQAMVVCRATVPALDAVRFVEIARSIDRLGLAAAMRGTSEQPLFPVWTWVVHRAIVCVWGEFALSWVTSVQVAAAIPLALAVAPVYLASRRLYGRRGALAGGLMFCVLPAIARLGAEGISDSTHLLWFAVAFWGVVESVAVLGPLGENSPDNRSAVGWLVMAGVATGWGVLSRVEIAVLPLAWGFSMVVFQWRPAWRQPTGRLVAAAGGYLLGLAMVLAPSLVAVDALAPRAAVERLLGIHEVPRQSAPARLAVEQVSRAVGTDPVPTAGTAAPFDVREHDIRQFGYAAALRQYSEELACAMNYWGLVSLLAGVWALRAAVARPLDRFGHVFFAIFSLAAVQFVASVGYLSARHLMPLVVVGIGLAGLGALFLGSQLAGWLGRLSEIRCARPAATWSLVACGLLLSLVQTAKPLHAARLADRQAGVWLAARGDARGAVLDTLGWTALYSGRSTFPYSQAKAAFADPRLAYVVVQGDETQGTSPRSRTLRYLLGLAGRVAAAFPSGQAGRSDVLVYRWHAERLNPGLVVRAGGNDFQKR